MEQQNLIKNLYKYIIKENKEIYKSIFENTTMNDIKDEYWLKGLKLYKNLSKEEKEVLLNIITQVEVDTVSNFLGILDGTVLLEGENTEFELKTVKSNKKINGDLQELFLEFDENNRNN